MNFIIIVARVLFVVAIGVVTVFWQSMLLFRMFTVISYSWTSLLFAEHSLKQRKTNLFAEQEQRDFMCSFFMVC